MKKVIDRSKKYFWGMVALFVLMLFTSGLIATFANEEELSPESVESTSAEVPRPETVVFPPDYTGDLTLPPPDCERDLRYALFHNDKALEKYQSPYVIHIWDTITLDYVIKEGYKIFDIQWGKEEFGDTYINENKWSISREFSVSSDKTKIIVTIAKNEKNPQWSKRCELTPEIKVSYQTPNCDDLQGRFSPTSGEKGTNVSANFQLKSTAPEWAEIEGYNWDKSYRNTDTTSATSHTYRDAGNFKAAVKLRNKNAPSGTGFVRCNETPISIEDDPTPRCSQLSYSFNTTRVSPGGTVRATFSTDEDWIKVSAINWRDGSAPTTNPTSPLTHTYTALGTYKPSFVLVNKNNTSKSVTCSADNYRDTANKTITISATCGNGVREADEECDGGAGCSTTCTWTKVSCESLGVEVNPKSWSLPLSVTAHFAPQNSLQVTKINRGTGSEQMIAPNTHQTSFSYNEPGNFTISVYGKNPGNQTEGVCRLNTPIAVSGMIPNCSNMGINLKNESGFAPLTTSISFAPHEDIKIESLSWGTGEKVMIWASTTAQYTYTQLGHYSLVVTASNKKNPDLRWECRLNDAVRVSSASCGDGRIEHLEQCDDGNTKNGDWCSSACQLESVNCDLLQAKVSPSSATVPFDTQLSFTSLTGFLLTEIDRGNRNILTGSQERLLQSPLTQKYNEAWNYTITLTLKTTVNHSTSSSPKISKCSISLSANQQRSSYSGGGGRSKDYCPNGDYSPTYYDWKCDAEKKEIPTPKKEGCEVVDRSRLPYFVDQRLPYSQELIDAYEWAYWLKMTTICPIQNADLEWGLRRHHMAKMISNFATKVFKMKPDMLKSCNYSDIADQSEEMKYYIKLSCQLWIMGYKADGKTQKSKFEPNIYVTRGQFITILSRLLWWEQYNNNKENHFYREHLWALKRERILDSFILNARAPELRGLALIMLHKWYKYQNNIPY